MFSCEYSFSPIAIEYHVFFLCIDIFSENDYKRKNVTRKCEDVLLAKLKEECQENFDDELDAK